MKKLIALTITVSALFLAGCCCTQPASKQWEYKVVLTPVAPSGMRPTGAAPREQVLNELSQQGWVFMEADGELLYFKRLKR